MRSLEDMEAGAPEGIAGAFTAVCDDPSAVHFNPAGLSQVERFSLYTFYKLLYGGLGEESAQRNPDRGSPPEPAKSGRWASRFRRWALP